MLDHARRPRNAGRLSEPSMSASVVNPLCGDEMSVDIALDGETIREVRFLVRGCAISTASASMLSEQIQGLTLKEVMLLEQGWQAALADEGAELPERLEALTPLLSVRDYPHRQSCACLPWDALRALTKSANTRAEEQQS